MRPLSPPSDPLPLGPAPQPFGPLLARLRLGRGWSQPRMAARLCAVSGVPTLSRHEISRWERGQRVPGAFWLGWLAVLLGWPAEHLAEAAARSRPVRSRHARSRPIRSRPARPGAVTGTGADRSRTALLALAGRWLTGPSGGCADLSHGWVERSTDAEATWRRGGSRTTRPTWPALADGGELAGLRRLDDLVGGADLTGLGRYRLRQAVAALRGGARSDRRRLLSALAETAQLAGWLAADAGDPTGALDAYRLGLRAADAADDRLVGGHVLGSASHLLAGAGDPAGALLLAHTGHAGIRRSAPPGLRALLLHRVAFAAASGGRHRLAYDALHAAERAAERYQPDGEPPWLYWLDRAELAAMTGRTLVVLGRPLEAESLLRTARRAGHPRGSALYGSWLALGYLQLGEVEQACAVADAALLETVRSGSVRAMTQVTAVRRRLADHSASRAARRHAGLLAVARPYLPRAVHPPRAASPLAVRWGHRRPASVMA